MRKDVLAVTMLTVSAVLGAVLFKLSSMDVASLTTAGGAENYTRLIAKGVFYLKSMLVMDMLLLASVSIIWFKMKPGVDSSTAIEQTPKSNSTLFVFSFTLLLGIILRTVHLNKGLWIDEYLTVINYIRPEFSYIASNFSDDNQHWLFSVLAKISVLTFGEAQWSVRLPAAIFGMLSIWATFRLGRLVFNDSVALLSGFLLAISYHHIWYSQNARGYTILLLGTILSVDLLIRALRSNRWKYWGYYSIALSISVAGHLTGVFVGIAHFIVLMIYMILNQATLRDYIKPIGSFALAAWITLHMFAIMIPQMTEFFLSADAASGTPNLHWKQPIWALSELIRSLGYPLEAGWLLIVLAGLTAIFALAVCFQKNRLYFFLTSVPAIILVVTMILLGRNLWPRLLFNMAGFAVLYIAFLACLLSDYIGKLSNAGSKLRFLPQIALALFFLYTTPGVYKHPKQDFNSALEFIDSNISPNDTVIALHMAGKIYDKYYSLDWVVANSAGELRQHASQKANTWIVYTLPAFIRKARPEIYSELQSNYQIAARFRGTLGDGDIIVMKNKNST